MSTAIRWIPMEPQPNENVRTVRCKNGVWECWGQLHEDGTALLYEWGFPAPHSPGDIIDGCRVVSVDVEQHDGAWHWKITVETPSEEKS